MRSSGPDRYLCFLSGPWGPAGNDAAQLVADKMDRRRRAGGGKATGMGVPGGGVGETVGVGGGGATAGTGGRG